MTSRPPSSSCSSSTGGTWSGAVHLTRRADGQVQVSDGRIRLEIRAAGSVAEILRPTVLEELFGSRFRLVGGPERPIPVLTLEEAP